jgi:hypothetical protein
MLLRWTLLLAPPLILCATASTGNQSSLRQLTSAALSSLWLRPGHQSPICAGPDCSSQKSETSYRQTIEDDIVLRFDLSTPEEARAIANAADTILLDIWTFKENWVHARIPESRVRTMPVFYILALEIMRSILISFRSAIYFACYLPRYGIPSLS